MGNDLYEKWRAESQKMIDNAIANSQQSQNKVHVSIDSVGAIKALVFGEEGIVSVEPCYDDEVAGKYVHRLAYPDEQKLKRIFSERTGITDISFTDDRFIEFVMKEIEGQSKDAKWNGVSWDNTYSRYKDILYSSMQEAVSAMWSKDVFCGKRKEKSPSQQRNVNVSEIKEVAEGERIESKNGAINAVTSPEEEKNKEGQSHNDE